MNRVVAERAARGSAAVIATDARAQMRRDNRVRQFDNIVVEQTGGAFEARFALRLADGQTIPVVRPFAT